VYGRQQLSGKSIGMTGDSGTEAAPGRAMLEHGVEDYEKLAHTGCKGQLLLCVKQT